MPKYAALLRGIGPLNPNMRNEKLRGVFESLGFKNVQTVISSGNVLFESKSTNIPKLEAKIEKALPEQLDFTSTTIIRSLDQLNELIKLDPFKGTAHGESTYLTVTFLKNEPKASLNLPQPDNKTYKILDMHDKAIFAVVDLTGKTPDLMAKLEKHYGKEITTRTWKTVTRIVDRLS